MTSEAGVVTPRVVSLVPAATDILRFLGVQPIGVSHCCDAEHLPVLTRSVIPEGLDQEQVDRMVSETYARGESLYRVDEALLERLNPDLILTQGVCEVCAVTPQEVARASSCLGFDAPTLLVNGTRLEDVFTDLENVAAALGVNADTRIQGLRDRLEAVRIAVANQPKPRVAVIEWLDPPFLAGHWVPDLLEVAGAQSLGAIEGAPSPRASWADVTALEPEVLLFSFCGYDLSDTLRDLERFELPFRSQRMWALDSQFFCALTPKVVRGAEILAGALHPHVWAAPSALEAARWRG
jgi:iron complex transport system substrate-binding protein